MRILLVMFMCCSLPSWGQTLEIDGVQLIVRSDLQVRPFVPGVASLAKVGDMAIMRKQGGATSVLGTTSTHYLAVAQEAVSGSYGLISNEISFKVRPGMDLPKLPDGLSVKPLVGKQVFLVKVESLPILQTVLLILKGSPQIEWTQSFFVTDVNRAQ